MNSDTPLSPRPLHHLPDGGRSVLTSRQLREHGVTAAEAAERCRPGGPWQRILPGVHLLHPGPATGEERLHAALLYTASRERPGHPEGAVPAPGTGGGPYGEAMITGLAALALHRFSAVPSLRALDRVDVLVPRARRLRGAGYVRFVRAAALPRPREITGLPTAPAARALADAVAQLSDASAVRRLLIEAVRQGHCEASSVVRELSRARLLSRAHVVDAVDALLAEGRAMAEALLYDMVRGYSLPEPLWNVELRLPGGPLLAGVDAYWPLQAVALEIDARTPRQGGGHDPLGRFTPAGEHMERLGITVVRVTPRKLRESLEAQAAVVRTALIASVDREPAPYVVIRPR
ncbi:hypothetical protein SBI_07088 [Streptomyces bingchenggensis BCW-1]|uniref:DUF559 domain-containing protein n=1 Tax=Streptomyces bingchenggensis (strain BCW-1) TaxID=749414 RepID=D7C3I3_STRBB|nr:MULTISPECIES: hypothetical protein [Streptomyces]ADI10208.1 hypothetical protein SBI_07088 [Streptomyces bingchenggensis BCW-1]